VKRLTRQCCNVHCVVVVGKVCSTGSTQQYGKFQRRKTVGIVQRRGLLRFRRAAKIVIILLRAGGVLSTHKHEFIDPIALVYRQFSDSLALDQSANDPVVFNPNYFRHSSYLFILKSARLFLQLNPISRQRQPKMLDTALRSLQLFNVFASYPVAIQRQLVEVAYLETFKPGKVLIKEGHRPERYYMVLGGQALRGNCQRLPAGNVQLKIHGVINTGDDFGNEDSIIIENAQVPSDFTDNRRYRHRTAYVAKTRTECIFAKTELSVLTLDKHDFLKIFHQYDSFDALKEYMETIDYFKHCNLDGLDKSDVKLRYFRENSLICCADELPRKLYIIRQGKAKVYRRVNSDEFIVAGVLTGGAGFGFNLTATRDDELYLVSHGCEIIVLDAAIFERMRNLKVNANLTLLTEQSSIVSESDARDQRQSYHQWQVYKNNLVRQLLSSE